MPSKTEFQCNTPCFKQFCISENKSGVVRVYFVFFFMRAWKLMQSTKKRKERNAKSQDALD